MTYKIEPRTLRLTLDAYDGAEVVCRLSVSIGDMFDLADASKSGDVRATYSHFGDSILISWDVQDEAGVAVPADGAGMLAIPSDMASMIMSVWSDQVAGVPLASASA